MYKSCFFLSLLALSTQTKNLDYGNYTATYCSALRSEGWGGFDCRVRIPFLVGLHLTKTKYFMERYTYKITTNNTKNISDLSESRKK